MAKARRIVLETRTFEKAADAMSYFSTMLRKYQIGSRVSETDAYDLRALLKRHDEIAEKTGVGIDYFAVERAPDGHPGQCFWIVRTDGTTIDISLKHCLERKPYD